MQIARLFLFEVNDKNVLCTSMPAKASCFEAHREPLMIDRLPKVGFDRHDVLRFQDSFASSLFQRTM